MYASRMRSEAHVSQGFDRSKIFENMMKFDDHKTGRSEKKKGIEQKAKTREQTVEILHLDGVVKTFIFEVRKFLIFSAY